MRSFDAQQRVSSISPPPPAAAAALACLQVTAAVVLLSALCIALLGVSIAAIVQAKDANDAVARLESSLASGTASPDACAAGLAGTPAGTAGAAAARVYASADPLPPAGYLAAGSLFRGSGYWSNSSSNLPAPRSDFAVAALPTAGTDPRTLIFILGGLDSSGSPSASAVSYDAVLDL